MRARNTISVYLTNWTGLDDPELVKHAVEVLEDADWIPLPRGIDFVGNCSFLSGLQLPGAAHIHDWRCADLERGSYF